MTHCQDSFSLTNKETYGKWTEKHSCNIPLSGPHKGTVLIEFKTALTFSVVSEDMPCVCWLSWRLLWDDLFTNVVSLPWRLLKPAKDLTVWVSG